MKYKIRNNSTDQTVWVDAFNQGNAFPLNPGATCAVADSTKTQLLREYSFLSVVPGTNGNGTILDENAPAYYSGAPGASWTLITLGPGTTQYSDFKMWSTTTAVTISFSGWNSDATNPNPSQTAPPTWSQIVIPVASASTPFIEFSFPMDPTNAIYALGTGTLTIIAC